MGSVGTRAWIALLLGRDERDPLFLQIKEAQPSVLEEFAGRSEYRNAGHRVVAGQRLMQAASDIFLGWIHVTETLDGGERDFYVRQLRDWKGSAEIEAMVPKGMKIYAQMCGWTLARAHARSGRPRRDRRLPRDGRRLRPGDRRVRRGLRRPERARLRPAEGRRGERAPDGGARASSGPRTPQRRSGAAQRFLEQRDDSRGAGVGEAAQAGDPSRVEPGPSS